MLPALSTARERNSTYGCSPPVCRVVWPLPPQRRPTMPTSPLTTSTSDLVMLDVEAKPVEATGVFRARPPSRGRAHRPATQFSGEWSGSGRSARASSG